MGLLHGDGDASIPGPTIQRRAGSLEPQRREPLLFVDLDGLKDINDRHGHRAGSMALRKAARVSGGFHSLVDFSDSQRRRPDSAGAFLAEVAMRIPK
jgi:hypothetical protein